MQKAIIVAAAQNRVIGINNKLPWYLPEDLKYFKHVTMGKPIIMGRKTWESIGRPLPGRTNIVLTQNADYSAEGAKVVNTWSEAVGIAEAVGEIDGVDEVMVIGGAGIYEMCLNEVNRLYYTKVHAEVAGDAWFPEVDWDQWQLVGSEDYKASGNNPYDYSFCVYDRVK